MSEVRKRTVVCDAKDCEESFWFHWGVRDAIPDGLCQEWTSIEFDFRKFHFCPEHSIEIVGAALAMEEKAP